jgi:hypothetical protein
MPKIKGLGLPWLLTGRSRVNFGQVDVVTFQGIQGVTEGSRLSVVNGEIEQCFVVAGGTFMGVSNDEEAGGVFYFDPNGMKKGGHVSAWCILQQWIGYKKPQISPF